ncbi:MAG TPA: sugar ABC transporter permease [Pseudonocardia sp.]|uniref:carbohydrate ABC transporter permease n=1 Tax=Pseudonocardia sp. TaxID=60912 RepID=UPI002C2173B3|nr:sugar ABC transporter permease [Pseudonocardia sp.]HTF51909.1 sugar ABC transporter permease [Pseudonocardia sp.]
MVDGGPSATRIVTPVPSAPRTAARGSARGRGRSQRRPGGSGWVPLAYLAPGFVVYAAFLLYPLGRAVHLSLFDWDGLTLATFVGLDNYLEVVTDQKLRAAFGHALVLIVFFAGLPTVIGLALAAVLNRAKVRGLGFFRTVVFLPQVVAMVVVGVAWRRLYAPDGSVNDVLHAIGLGGLARAWLGDTTLALPAVGVVGTWVQTGLVTLLLMAGMSRVPDDLYEAARLDGAGAVREFFAITLPSVRGELAVALTLTVIAALKTFDLIYITTGGGPGDRTSVPAFEVYNRAFRLGEVGSAAAVGVTLTLVIFVINLAIARIGERGNR